MIPGMYEFADRESFCFCFFLVFFVLVTRNVTGARNMPLKKFVGTWKNKNKNSSRFQFFHPLTLTHFPRSECKDIPGMYTPAMVRVYLCACTSYYILHTWRLLLACGCVRGSVGAEQRVCVSVLLLCHDPEQQGANVTGSDDVRTAADCQIVGHRHREQRATRRCWLRLSIPGNKTSRRISHVHYY